MKPKFRKFVATLEVEVTILVNDAVLKRGLNRDECGYYFGDEESVANNLAYNLVANRAKGCRSLDGFADFMDADLILLHEDWDDSVSSPLEQPTSRGELKDQMRRADDERERDERVARGKPEPGDGVVIFGRKRKSRAKSAKRKPRKSRRR